MGLFQKLIGYTSGNGVEVDANHQLLVALPNDNDLVGKALNMSQNDDGTLTGVTYYLSPETDSDYRQRCSSDCMLDEELFNYTAQNTTKHTIYAAATNLAPSWTTGGYNTNPTGVLTATSGASLATYAMFSHISTGTLAVDFETSFTGQPTANSVIDFGFFLGAVTNPFAPTDGVYFRLNSSGLQGIANYGGTEASTGVFHMADGAGTWAYTLNKKYQFIIYITSRDAEFWVNGGGEDGALLLGKLDCPDGQGTMNLAASLPVHIRHAIAGGAAGAALSMTVSRYAVRLGGVTQTDSLALFGSRALQSYQALPGSGSFVGLQGNAISSGATTAPTAAALTNTTNAGLIAGLGTWTYETFTTALNVEGIVTSYQCPAGTTAVQGRRLKINGVSMAASVQTVLAGGPQVRQFYLVFGGTTVSLQASESGFVKLGRRYRLPFVQTITANQAVNTLIAQNVFTYTLTNPIYVNPGEWVQVVEHAFGTVGASGVISHVVTFDYSWE